MNQTAEDNSDAGPDTDSVIAVVQYCTKAIKEVGFIFDCLICKVFAQKLGLISNYFIYKIYKYIHLRV